MIVTLRKGQSWLRIEFELEDAVQFSVSMQNAHVSVLSAEHTQHKREAIEAACLSGVRFGRKIYKGGQFEATILSVEGRFVGSDLQPIAECMSICLRVFEGRHANQSDRDSYGWEIVDVK